MREGTRGRRKGRERRWKEEIAARKGERGRSKEKEIKEGKGGERGVRERGNEEGRRRDWGKKGEEEWQRKEKITVNREGEYYVCKCRFKYFMLLSHN